MIDVSSVPRDEYVAAQPFPHAVFQDAFSDPSLLDAVAEESWSAPQDAWKEYQQGKSGLKEFMRHGPASSRVGGWLLSSDWVGRLERLTGIGRLVADPTWAGGGVHRVERGGSLGVHVDFNRLGRLYRRVNVLIYLNRIWAPEWRGDLWLCDGKARPQVVVPPVFNTAVVFTASDKSWHGHPKPLECPLEIPRLSIAAYYYSAKRPKGYKRKHSTIYRERRP